MSHQWKELSDGYGQSKWVAEQMCMQARSRGLPVSILRPGNMSPSSRTGVWNPSDFIFMLLQVRSLRLVRQHARPTNVLKYLFAAKLSCCLWLLFLFAGVLLLIPCSSGVMC